MKTLIKAISLVFGLTVSVAAASSISAKNDLPEIGTAAASVLSLEKERLMGNVIRRQLQGSAPIIQDPIVDEYINDLGNRLLAKSDNVKFNFDFSVINANSINAFATFGGTVVIHNQTMFEAQTESELASVVAHEIAHVTQRHIARRTEKMQQVTPLSTAAMIGAIVATIVNPTVGSAALMSTVAGQQQLQLNYTRHNEKEADRIGLDTLTAAGFDPKGAETFFGRMAEKTRYSSKLPPMLYSHPLPESRMADIKSRVDTLPHRMYPESLDFQLVKIRLAVRYRQDADYHIEKLTERLKHASDYETVYLNYGLALAYLENKKYRQAEEILSQLRSLDSDNLYFIDALTDTYIGLKAFDKADKMLLDMAAKQPNNQVIVLNHANMLIMQKDYKRAIDMLKDFTLYDKGNHLAWLLLTDAYKGAEMSSHYHQTKAEVYAQKLAFPQAIDELHTAHNKTPKNHLADKKRISARIKQLREEEAMIKSL
ncbi:M48 family metallopeptidase [Catenovulum sp. SM1970]|uniref:M48 family metalloprotease n=1 Tax=Marinifaba aquimaris TaxID=2741323 RepID=UPI001573ED1D|nr:M48 family metalloprotease [Marinifaba aquimaris]NTS75971.1 M48 family metallopeptidase [Marinifaba aquimaris]